MLGITTETTSRSIVECKRQGLLVETSPNLLPLDVQMLERIEDE